METYQAYFLSPSKTCRLKRQNAVHSAEAIDTLLTIAVGVDDSDE